MIDYTNKYLLLVYDLVESTGISWYKKLSINHYGHMNWVAIEINTDMNNLLNNKTLYKLLLTSDGIIDLSDAKIYDTYKDMHIQLKKYKKNYNSNNSTKFIEMHIVDILDEIYCKYKKKLNDVEFNILLSTIKHYDTGGDDTAEIYLDDRI